MPRTTVGSSVWLTSTLLKRVMPYAVVAVCITVISVLSVIASSTSVIPKSYICVPWSKQAVSSVLQIDITSFGEWFVLNVLLFCMTFLYGIMQRATSFWVWKQSDFYKTTGDRLDPHASMPFAVELIIMAYGGELLVTIFGYVGLLFSFVHISYLINTILARGSVIVLLTKVTQNNTINQTQETELLTGR